MVLYLDLSPVLEGDGDPGILGDGHIIDHRQPVLIPEDRQWLPLHKYITKATEVALPWLLFFQAS